VKKLAVVVVMALLLTGCLGSGRSNREVAGNLQVSFVAKRPGVSNLALLSEPGNWVFSYWSGLWC